MFAMILVSCGKSKGEQMLYDYQQESVKSGLNMNVEDLELEIKEVKEVEQITAADSAKVYKEKLVHLWLGEDANREEADTLTYEYVITELDTLKNRYQEIILANIRADRSYANYEWKEKRDNMIDAYSDAVFWKMVNDAYLKKPDSVLSVKYQGTYSIKNPLLNNNKQTFDKYFYSDPKNEKFIKEEMVAEADSE